MHPETHKQIPQCNRCGSCLSVCPVYQVELIESRSPRGKMALARRYLENDLPISSGMKDILSECLLCGSCMTVCPAGVQGSRVFTDLRRESLRSNGFDWRALLIGKLLNSNTRMAEAARIARLGRSLMDSAPPLRNLMGRKDLTALPSFNDPFFRFRTKAVTRPHGEPRGKVAYFYGCATDFLFAHVGESIVRALTLAGYEVHTPHEQMCCGIPALMRGDYERARENMARNIDLLSSGQWDLVVVDCATCGSALKYEYPRVLEALGLDSGKARRLSERVRDVTELLEESGPDLPENPAPPRTRRVTYHDPCHLARVAGIRQAPRSLLLRLPGVEFVEMENADSCCGGGGLFRFDHPEIASRIMAQKERNILDTGAEIVATCCPSCRMTLDTTLAPRGIEVCHPVELLFPER